MTMRQENAETLAMQALVWLAGQEEHLSRFVALTGVGPASFRQRAQDPVFLGAVLDFLMSDDATVIAFCDSEGIAYDQPRAARIALPGGRDMDWG